MYKNPVYNFWYDKAKLKKMVKFYAPTWSIFAVPVTHSYVHCVCNYIHECMGAVLTQKWNRINAERKLASDNNNKKIDTVISLWGSG